jgi:2-polyprenyl-3-methyl-5-hydroxy-6-metoxy-1,4-benzoquinol methylase
MNTTHRQAQDGSSERPHPSGEAFYKTYTDFKAWGTRGTGADNDATYASELRRAGVKAPAKILEIGFGDGIFLDWARRQGYQVTGIELIDGLVTSARARGHNVYCGTAQATLASTPDRYDLIVAFDVFEHLLPAELLDLMRFAKSILAPGGRIVARFPNGTSPFSGAYQHGDVTHLQTLNGESLRQITHAVGLRLIGVHNAARPTAGGAVHGALRKRAGYAARDLIEITLGLLYFGKRTPLDPNMTVIITACDDGDA